MFLCTSLFELGLQPQLANLYPEVQYPVSRGTPMISPLVRWEHSEEWHVMKYVAEVKLQFRFENCISYFTVNSVHLHCKDQSLETIEINIFCSFGESFEHMNALSAHGLVILNTETHAVL
jgi:hypothetical protein